MIEPALYVIVRGLEAKGLILLWILPVVLVHDNYLCTSFLLEDLRKSSEWIPIRLVAAV